MDRKPWAVPGLETKTNFNAPESKFNKKQIPVEHLLLLWASATNSCVNMRRLRATEEDTFVFTLHPNPQNAPKK